MSSFWTYNNNNFPIGAFLVMLGYISVTFISENINLRKSIYKITQESKLLNLIEQAEIERDSKDS